MPSEESRCDALIAQMYGKDAIVRFGRRGRRTTGTKGVPDRAYFVGGPLLWWECKEGRDRLSADQRHFLLSVIAGGGMAGCGSATDLLDLLRKNTTGTATVEKWSR